jgi:hypothetical protein
MRLLVACGLSAVAVIRCSSAPSDAASDSDHPIPSTRSVVPLQLDNRWTYHYTMYDSAGNVEPLSDRSLECAITGIYKRDGSTLLPVDGYEARSDTTGRYIYRYEWENLDSGYLVEHVGSGELERRGLYIVGTFVGAANTLFDAAQLWYAYPASTNEPWQIDIPGGDTALSTFECVSKVHKEYFVTLDGSGPSPLRFIDSCYLFKQTIHEHVFYHCFHPDYGKLSMLHYYKGILRESYILTAELLSPW